MRTTLLLVCSVCAVLEAKVQTPPAATSLTREDWKQIRAAYEKYRHGVFPDREGFHARNFTQQWLARFDARGFTVEPGGASWRWGLELTGVKGKARVRADGNRVSYRWPDGLEEWFVNDTRGLEHGFTLPSPREIRLAIRGGGQARETEQGVEFTDPTGAVRVKYTGLAAWDATGKTLPATMRVTGRTVVLAVDDRGAHYPVTIDPVAQQAYLKASNTARSDGFGYSVAASGDTVVVGALNEDSTARGVNGDPSSRGATESGAAYVFVRSGSTWTQQAYLKASNADARDGFGYSVSISGDTVVVGAAGESSSATAINGNQNDNSAQNAGAAYVFVRTGATWSQQAYLKASNADAQDLFGLSVAISGDTIVAGAYFEDSNARTVNGSQTGNSLDASGAAYVFVRSGATWTQQAYLKASNADAQDRFGFSVAISGDMIVAGAYLEDSAARGVNGDQNNNAASGAGAAYVFVRGGGAWTQQAYLKAADAIAGDSFGFSVAASGDTVLVGAPSENSSARGIDGNAFDTGASNAGAAYVFSRTGAAWSQQAYLKASNADALDNFGWSVALSGDAAVVGALSEYGAAKGVNGVETSNSAPASGAAYSFVRSGGAWTQQAYLKASNSEEADFFGAAVAISGNTFVAGAPGEASAAAGIGGDQNNNSAPSSGAAYVFLNAADSLSIIAPVANQVIGVAGVGFQWSPSPDATGYDLRIAQGGATVFQGNLLGGSSTSTLVSLPDGVYTFRVRACTGGFTDAQCGGFAAVNFAVAQTRPSARPTIVSPAAGQEFTTSTQTFSWTAVAGAGSYDILLTDLFAGGVPELSMSIGGAPPATSTVFSMRGSSNYRLQVRACTVACGDWSDPVNFRVLLPPVPSVAPAKPTCSLAAQTLTCSWNAVANADFYTLQAVQATAGPGGGALTVAGFRTAQTNGAVALPPGPTSIFVAACNGNGCGPYSSPSEVNPSGPSPGAPLIGNPVGGASLDGPDVFFSWNRVAGDNGSNTVYRLYVQDFSRQAPALDILTRSNFWSAKFRGGGSRYDAVVVANGANGPAVPFLVRGASPASPTMAQPRHQSQDVTLAVAAGNVQLGWTPVPGATLYEYLVSVQGQAQPTARGITPGLIVQVPLPANSTFYSGIVRACPAGQTCTFGSDAGWGPWSSSPGQGGVTNFLAQ